MRELLALPAQPAILRPEDLGTGYVESYRADRRVSGIDSHVVVIRQAGFLSLTIEPAGLFGATVAVIVAPDASSARRVFDGLVPLILRNRAEVAIAPIGDVTRAAAALGDGPFDAAEELIAFLGGRSVVVVAATLFAAPTDLSRTVEIARLVAGRL
ncbi:MAG: hypothetical protein IT307_13700 [Chloroflexi bacterium]|nr:hypothetical protein [Chloroflexota bacterium]